MPVNSPGAFQVVLQTKNQSSNDALKLILQQLRDIQSAPVSDAEMQSAKKSVIGSFPLKLDRQSVNRQFHARSGAIRTGH